MTAITYSIYTNFGPNASFDPLTPIVILTLGVILQILLAYSKFARSTFRTDLANRASPPTQLSSSFVVEVGAEDSFLAHYIPVSASAIAILRLISTCAALYLAFLVLVNAEVLVLFIFVLKQRAYSWLYKELGTPVVGPVWMTQTRKLRLFFFISWSRGRMKDFAMRMSF